MRIEPTLSRHGFWISSWISADPLSHDRAPLPLSLVFVIALQLAAVLRIDHQEHLAFGSVMMPLGNHIEFFTRYVLNVFYNKIAKIKSRFLKIENDFYL